MRIHCTKRATCRTDTCHGGTTHGGSESTTDHTCRRRETVEECGEQPLEPRRMCATRERSQGERRRNGNKGKPTEQKATLCTSSSTFPLQPLQQQQQQQCGSTNDEALRSAEQAPCVSSSTSGVVSVAISSRPSSGRLSRTSTASSQQARTTVTRISSWSTSCTAMRPMMATTRPAGFSWTSSQTWTASVQDRPDGHSRSDNFLIDSVLDVVRLETEGCDCLQARGRLARLLSYLVKFQIPDVLKLTVRVLDTLRTAEEFSTLGSRI